MPAGCQAPHVRSPEWEASCLSGFCGAAVAPVTSSTLSFHTLNTCSVGNRLSFSSFQLPEAVVIVNFFF